MSNDLKSLRNLEQPAKRWFDCAIKNLGELYKKGDEPVIEINVGGATFEFRFVKVVNSKARMIW